MNITCLACDHSSIVADGPAFEDGLFQCDECGARMALGRLLPRVVVEPFRDARGFMWIRTRYQDPKTKTDLFVDDRDPKHAGDVAKNILSLVLP